jgi:urease accessory protein UreF
MGKGKKDRKKEKKAGKAAQEGKAVKLPKQLRKAGSLAMDLARQPVVSEVVAAALLSAAAALRADKKAVRAAGAAGAEAADAASEAGKQASKMGDALRELAIDLARKTLDNWERPDGPRQAKGKPGSPSAKA